jgi:hypothetical protein
MSGAAIALVLRQVVIMALSVGSSVAVSRWLGHEVVGRFAILLFVSADGSPDVSACFTLLPPPI